MILEPVLEGEAPPTAGMRNSQISDNLTEEKLETVETKEPGGLTRTLCSTQSRKEAYELTSYYSK